MKHDDKLNTEKNVYKRILMDSGHYKNKVNDYYFILAMYQNLLNICQALLITYHKV